MRGGDGDRTASQRFQSWGTHQVSGSADEGGARTPSEHRPGKSFKLRIEKPAEKHFQSKRRYRRGHSSVRIDCLKARRAHEETWKHRAIRLDFLTGRPI